MGANPNVRDQLRSFQDPDGGQPLAQVCTVASMDGGHDTGGYRPFLDFLDFDGDSAVLRTSEAETGGCREAARPDRRQLSQRTRQY
jgi:hypothetical protein